jgi:hypothetical protein
MVLKSFKPSIQEIAPLIKDVVSSGRDVRLTVTGYSMYPLLRDKTDDVILGSFEKISKYDVVLFERENGSYIFHRVIKVKGDVLTIAGDNETVKEYPVKTDRVIAVMKSFIRSGKEYPVSLLWYRLYARLWLFIFPFRPFVAKLYNRLAKIYRKFNGGAIK